ncbi:MAG TPA: class I SAM-dependent methyltransferase [Candidatus Wunengus sp. YC61]|uniref:class I SAM-dependent methyltransferase n=1 Tax=Candidatus Wunengus sp. YC61 TaxID=3367698 RepID=UPI004027C2B0
MEQTPEYDQQVEQKMRNVQAANFDTWYIQDKGFWYNKTEIDSVVSLLACKKEDVILDAGCGTGRISIRIASQIRRLICVDFSIDSLLILQKKLPSGLYSKVRCITADLSKMPIRGNSFSKIVSVQVIQHIPSHEKRLSVLRSFHGLLQKGGHLVFTVFRWNGAVWINKEGYYAKKLYRYAFEADEIKTLVKEAGFDEISIQPLIVQHLRLQRFGLWTTYLDRLLARFLNPKRFGQFLLIAARKL